MTEMLLPAKKTKTAKWLQFDVTEWQTFWSIEKFECIVS